MKIILVTGSNRGIGLEIAKELASQGHIVIAGSRNKTNGDQAFKEVEGNIDVQKLDVTDPENISELASYIQQEYGKLDVLINNAGIINTNAGSMEADLKEVRATLESNVFGPWKLSQACYPLLQKSEDGRIINMSSGMGAHDDLVSGHAAYRMSKAFLNDLTILMANETKGVIKVNAMCPGWVRTDMGGASAPRSVEQGADTAVWLATATDIGTGGFYRDRSLIKW